MMRVTVAHLSKKPNRNDANICRTSEDVFNKDIDLLVPDGLLA